MKIIHVLGRGLEGCGVSRYAIEFHNWAKKAGHDSFLIALEKPWTVGAYLKKTLPDLLNLKPADFESYIDDILAADLVITHSFPPKSSDAEVCRVWNKLIESPRQAMLVHTCHDHHPMSWARNYDFFPGILKHDGMLVHATNGKLPAKVKALDSQFPVLPLVLGMEFGNQSDWVPTKQQQRRISYVGRYANFKDPSRMIPLWAQIGAQNDIEVTLFGIARVIESAWIRGHYQCRDMERSAGKKDFTRRTDRVGFYQAYPREVGLEYLRHTAVMADFYTLPVYGLSMEYAMFEAVDCGSVLLTEPRYVQEAPVFLNDGVVGDYITPLTLAATLREPLIFTVNGKDLPPVKVTTEVGPTDRIVEVMNSAKTREEIRQEAFAFAKSLHSSAQVFPWTIEQIL